MKAILLTFTLWTVISCGKEKPSTPKILAAPKMEDVVTTKVIATDFKEFHSYYANTLGSKQAQLMHYSGGEVKKIKVKDGQTIKKGQSLCNIDAAQAKTQKELTQVFLTQKENELNRIKSHFDKKQSSVKELNTARYQYLQAKVNVIEAKKIYRGALCIAPFSGKVASHQIEEHQTIAPHSPTLVIVQDKELRFKFGIPESEIDGYQTGNEVEIITEDSNSYAGKIHSISLTLNQNNRTYSAEVHAKNSKSKLRIGGLYKIKALRRTYRNELVIPSDAILALSRSNIVMVAEKDIAVQKKIDIIATTATHSLVRGELKEGDQLIIRGQSKVNHGSLLKIHLGE